MIAVTRGMLHVGDERVVGRDRRDGCLSLPITHNGDQCRAG